ncbi:hypothetical protein [Maribacter sp.]|uniref:hypothetical protein n=1 Tax=Maribacter sp. TaxID=1897614 RepID=UPI0025B86A95|nr:hypothetical protein [Maribacter sp.]
MTELSLEEMMRYMIEGKRQTLYVTLAFFSIVFGVICLLLFVLKNYFITEDYKIVVNIILVLFTVIYLFFVGYILYNHRYAKNRTPYGGGIYKAYYKCAQCKSLHGGIYGKGPTKSIILDKECVHKWSAIDSKMFDKIYQLQIKNEN